MSKSFLSSEKMLNALKINPSLTLDEDRKAELLDYTLNDPEIIELMNFRDPQSREYKDWMYQTYFTNMNSEEEIYNSYLGASKPYIVRHMIGKSDKISDCYEAINFVHRNHILQDNSVAVLDLGCGIGDHAIIFAKMGFDVTACDLETPLLHFVKNRFDRRKLNIKTFGMNGQNSYFNSKKKYDFIFCRNFLEHTLRPDIMVEYIYSMLKPGGFLFSSTLTPGTETYVGGTHTYNAIAISKTDAYSRFWKRSFSAIDNIPGLYRKIPRIVVLEGLVGAGKSTVIKKLHDLYGFDHVNLPASKIFMTEHSSISPDFSNAHLYFNLDRLKLLLAMNGKSEIVLIERNLLSTIGFYISDTYPTLSEKEIEDKYKEIVDREYSEISEAISTVIVLDIPANSISERLDMRGQTNVIYQRWTDIELNSNIRNFFGVIGKSQDNIISIDATRPLSEVIDNVYLSILNQFQNEFEPLLAASASK